MYRLLYCIRICKKTCINIYIYIHIYTVYVYAFVDVHVLVCIFKVSFGACESFTGLLCPVSNLETFLAEGSPGPRGDRSVRFLEADIGNCPYPQEVATYSVHIYGGLGVAVY